MTPMEILHQIVRDWHKQVSCSSVKNIDIYHLKKSKYPPPFDFFIVFLMFL